jgi:thioredoxin 1
MIEKIYEEEFTDRVLKSENPVLVDFYADWCGPCKMLSPILEQLENENDEFEFFKINIDENQDVAEQYEVFSIPNVVIFKNGEAVARSVGFKGTDEMQAFIDSAK